jgi:hypothetical protein
MERREVWWDGVTVAIAVNASMNRAVDKQRDGAELRVVLAYGGYAAAVSS